MIVPRCRCAVSTAHSARGGAIWGEIGFRSVMLRAGHSPRRVINSAAVQVKEDTVTSLAFIDGSETASLIDSAIITYINYIHIKECGVAGTGQRYNGVRRYTFH